VSAELRPARVRAMEVRDVEQVAALERETFSTPWRPRTFRGLLDREGVVLRVLERAEGEVAGYTVLWCIGGHGELANIAVREELRGRGLGRALLDDALAQAARRGVSRLYLEVRESNEGARALYAAHGFEAVGRRRAYYERPREDALVLVRVLARGPDGEAEVGPEGGATDITGRAGGDGGGAVARPPHARIDDQERR